MKYVTQFIKEEDGIGIVELKVPGNRLTKIQRTY